MSETRTLDIVQVSTADVMAGAERIAADLHRASLARAIDSHLAVGFCFDDVPGSVLIPNDERRSRWARTLLRLQPRLPRPPIRPSIAALAVRRALKVAAEPGRAWRRSRGYEDFDYPGTAGLATIGGRPTDILHLHNLHSGYFDLRCLPRLSAEAPTVVTLHDTWLTTGHCAYTLECERWRTGCGSCPHLDSQPAVLHDKTAENWALKRDVLSRSAVHVVGPSQWILDRVPDSILGPAAVDVHLIPNGVDQSIFKPGDKQAARAELGLPADHLVVVFNVVSERNLYKDMATVRAALPSIVEGVAPRPVLVVALGGTSSDGPGGAKILGVPFLKEPVQVARYLQAADLAIHAARAENHSLAVLEAQSCGLAVVASDVGGMGEALVDGVTGLLVPPRDPGSLAAAASALLGDDARRERMGRAAAEHAREAYSLDRMVEQYLKLYASIRRR
jgi:glycosyltransferase involved in cell wall biosynthesis